MRQIENLREWASAALAPRDPLGIARHLLLNEQRRGEPGEVLRLLGFVHVLTATGIHLYALATWSSRIAGGLLAIMPLSQPVALAWALAIRRALTFLLWLLAWLLAGGRAGMLRPWIVVLLRLGGQRLGIRWRRWSPLLLALAVDLGIALYHSLAHHPGAWAPGRWMYALAVGGGLMSQEAPASDRALAPGSGRARDRPSHWRQHAALAVGSWVFVALWEAAHLGLVAPWTPVLSLLTLPLFCVGVFPLFLLALVLRLCAIPGAGEALLARAAQALHWMFVPLVEAVLRLPGLWVVSLPSLSAGAGLCAVTFAAGAGLSRRGRAGLTLLLVGSSLGVKGAMGVLEPAAPSAPLAPAASREDRPPQAERITLLDIGQGDAALIEYRDEEGRRRAGLIDTGSEEALTEAGWIQLLAHRGITRLDWIALTHLDADHSGALGRLQRLLPVGCVVTGPAQLQGDRLERLLTRLPRGTPRPEGWRSDCVPYPAYTTMKRHARGRLAERLAGNGNMTVLWIPLRGGGGFLDTGDLDGSEELSILPWLRPWLRKHREAGPLLLKVSHHGSAHSTSAAFLAAVRPDEAWISAGYGNRYGHPAPQILERLQDARLPTRRTDREGALEWSARQLKAADARRRP